MSGINFSDNIEARSRKLYLQTSLNEDDRIIISELFDSGRLLVKKEFPLIERLKKSEIPEYVESLHLNCIGEIELLYDISLKIKTIKHARSLCELGAQFLKWNLLDEAISELELAIKYNLKSGEVYKYLAKAYSKKGGKEEAEIVLKNGIKAFPEYPDLWMNLGVVCFEQNKLQEAASAFRKAVEINSSYADALFYISRVFTEAVLSNRIIQGLKDIEECSMMARENLSRAIAISERYRSAGSEKVMRLFHSNKWKEASVLMDEIIKNIPPVIDLSFDGIFYLNLLYGEKGRNLKSVHDYVKKLKSLTEKHPDFPDLHNKLGIAYLIECRNLFNRALHHFKKAEDLNPGYEESSKNLKLAQNDGKGLMLLLRAMLK